MKIKEEEKEKYHDQYCEKHDQYYADFLHQCPICRGEEYGKLLPIYYKIKAEGQNKG